jgi:hypothetical protein
VELRLNFLQWMAGNRTIGDLGKAKEKTVVLEDDRVI